MKLIGVSVVIVLFGMPAFADAFMTLFIERQAMIKVFGFDHTDDCVGYDATDLRRGLVACNEALRETVEVMNADNKHVKAELLGVLAMEYLARSKILERMGRVKDAKSDCTRAVKYARLIGDREKLDFFEQKCP